VDVNAAARNGWSPAFAASQRGHVAAVRALCELGADLNAVEKDGWSPLAFASLRGKAEMVRNLCVLGACRNGTEWHPNSAVEVAQLTGNNEVVDFLKRTEGFVNPLQYSGELTLGEARFLLRSEHLRDFPELTPFRPRGSAACRLIEQALVWSTTGAALFPGPCRRRAKELLLIPWPLPAAIVVGRIMPLVIDRFGDMP